jgi:uncharacterized protein (TIGR03382 family)
MSRGASVVCALALCACARDSSRPVTAEGRRTTSVVQAASLQAPFFDFFALPATRDAGPAASEAEQFVTLGDRVFFVARGGDRLVWVTDGTDEGTAPVSTISLEYGYPTSAAKLVAFDGGVFFAGVDRSVPSYNLLSWVRTEGDPEHTQILQPVRSFVPTGEQVAFGGALFIVATDFDHGEELWKSDGTEAGTLLFKDILTGSIGSSPANLTVLGPILLFTADDGTGRTLWKSDGTAAGTVKVDVPDAGALNPSGLTVSNGKVFFAVAGRGGNEPWVSDGTPGGTVRLIDPVSDPSGRDPHGFVTAGTSTAFLAGPAQDQQRLWRWNGSVAKAETDAGLITGLVGLDQNVLYTVFGPPITGVWTSNGTSSPTFLRPVFGHYGGQMVDPVVFEHEAFFGSSDSAIPDTLNDLWVSDGTSAGTHPAFGAPLAGQAVTPHHMTATPLGLLFAAGNYDWPSFFSVSELWLSDGTENGTHPIIAPVAAGVSSSPGTPVVSGTEVFWPTGSGDVPSGLWHSNGDGRAIPVPGIQQNSVLQLIPVPGGVLVTNAFFAGPLLLVTPDGGAQPLPLPPVLAGWAVLDAATVLATYGNGVDPGAVWVSDGTVQGTHALEDLPTDGGAAYPYNLLRFRDRAYFFGGSPAHLFSTDGQTSSVVFDFPQNEYFPGPSPWPVAVVGDQLYFATSQHLYVSDGTEAHAAFTFDYPVQPPQQIFGTSRHLIFSSSGMLFSFDGSDAGAQLIAGSSAQSFDFVPLGAVGDRFYFRHREWDAYGTQIDALWATDGTDAGTRFVAPVAWEDVSYYPAPPLVSLSLEAEGRIVFPAHGRFAGTELWVSDGTQSGTRPVVEIARGPLPSRPGLPVRFGNELLVPAETHVTGRELWSIDLAAVTDNVPPELTCPADVTVSTGDPAGKTVSFTPAAHDEVTDVRITSQPASGSKFPVGITQVQVRATDAFGNARTCTFQVAVSLVAADGGSTHSPSPAKSGCSATSQDSVAMTAFSALLVLLALARRRAIGSTGSS